MVYKLEITIVAEKEYSSSFHYYEEQQPGLGDRFEKETDYLMEKLIHIFFKENTNTIGKQFISGFHII